MHALLGTFLSILLVAGLASAGDEKKPRSAQAQRMSDCSAEAHDKQLAGDARKQFMSQCLKGPAARDGDAKAPDAKRAKSTDGGAAHDEKAAAGHGGKAAAHGDNAAPPGDKQSAHADKAGGQGEKMKICNQTASTKNLHGDERKQFMSQCLKGEQKS